MNIVSLAVHPPPSLTHYDKPGVPPPSARIDPHISLRTPRPIRFRDMWRYALVASTKALEVAHDLLAFQFVGPKRKTWGIEITLITSIMRGAGEYTELFNINTIRLLMSLTGFIPLPADALITPVTFSVKRRGLRGILEPYDAAEIGTRELSGEWIVGSRKMWHQLQAEWRKARYNAPSAEKPPKPHTEKIVYYIHGGAYYVSSAAAQRLISIPLSKYTDARVFALDYRLAPETTFPGPLHDVVAGYFRLVEDLHIPPENIIVAGDSAGGGLALALLMYLRDNSYPLPSSAILMSPWVDLTMSCESWDSNAEFDVIPMPKPGDPLNPVYLYLGATKIREYLTHPYASPLFGDFTGLPPLLIQAGDAEVLRDEITLLAHKSSLAGVEVQHELYQDAIHIFQLYPFLECARQSFLSMREFTQQVVTKSTMQPLDPTTEKELDQELENDAATVVRADGTEIVVGMEEVRKEIELVGGSDSDDTKEPEDSWFRSRPITPNLASLHLPTFWSSRTAGHPADTNIKAEGSTSTEPTKPAGTRKRSETLPASSTPPVIQTTNANNNQNNKDEEKPATSPPKQVTKRRSWYSRRQSPGTLNLPPAPLMREDTPPPSPSIRKTAWSGSHPDLYSLVQTWNHDGPANATWVYKSPSRPLTPTS